MAAPAAFGEGSIVVSEGEVSFEVEAGKANDVTVTASASSVTIADSADTIEPPPGKCVVSEAGKEVECNAFEFAFEDFFNVDVDVGDESDSVTASGSIAVFALGGEGNDALSATGFVPFEGSGGEGNDTIDGGSGLDRLEGGLGADIVNGNGGNDIFGADADPGDSLNGGSGNDFFLGAFGDGGGDLLNGGSGFDRIFYLSLETEAPPPDYTVSLGNGSIASGGETDALIGVEDATTFQGGDSVTGSDGANRIVTSTDEESLIFLLGGVGDIGIDAGDTVDPKAGPDFVKTGANNDIVDLVDGFADRLDCGSGNDIVDADQLDELVDCENVDRTTVGSEDDSTPPAPPPPPAADVVLPACGLGGLRRSYPRKAFLRGLRASIVCNEPVILEAQLATPAKAALQGKKGNRRKGKRGNRRSRGRAAASRAGDLILAEAVAPAFPAASLRLNPIGNLRSRLGNRFRANVRIVARDLAGNATVLQRVVRVVPDRKKGKRRRQRGR